MPKTVKGALWDFLTTILLQNFTKIEGEPIGVFEKFSKKKQKMRIFNSLIVPKNLKEGTIWDFLAFVLLQNIKTNWRGDPLRTLKSFWKKVSQSRKKGGVS